MSLLSSTRCFSTSAILKRTVANFSLRKEGTGSGPFVELPDVEPLHDSILLRLPSSSTVVGKLNSITVINASHTLSNVELKQLLAVQKYGDEFIKLSTGDEPVNLICTSSNALGRVTLLNIDDYDRGWTLLDPVKNILCYAGDIIVNENNVKGRGIVAINGLGPTWELQLGNNEELMVPAKSLLAHSASVNVEWEKNSTSPMLAKYLHLKPKWLSIPEQVSKWYANSFKEHYDKFRLTINKYFQKHKFMARVIGPGLVIVQSPTTTTKKMLYDDKDILKALNHE